MFILSAGTKVSHSQWHINNKRERKKNKTVATSELIKFHVYSQECI